MAGRETAGTFMTGNHMNCMSREPVLLSVWSGVSGRLEDPRSAIHGNLKQAKYLHKKVSHFEAVFFSGSSTNELFFCNRNNFNEMYRFGFIYGFPGSLPVFSIQQG